MSSVSIVCMYVCDLCGEDGDEEETPIPSPQSWNRLENGKPVRSGPTGKPAG